MDIETWDDFVFMYSGYDRLQSAKDKVAVQKFLFILRDSGCTNMLGAVPWMRQAFAYGSNKEAQDDLFKWMKGELVSEGAFE